MNSPGRRIKKMLERPKSTLREGERVVYMKGDDCVVMEMFEGVVREYHGKAENVLVNFKGGVSSHETSGETSGCS